MKVLVIEAPARSFTSLEKTLLRQDFNVSAAASHDDAMQMLECFDHDIVVLHEVIEGGPAAHLLRKVRMKGIKTPIIMVAANDSTLNVVDIFSAGADDFITQAVNQEELVARIKAVVRRTRGIASSILHIGGLTLDLGNKSAFAAGKALKLTIKEYELLQALAIRKGRTVTKESLMSLLYNHDSEPEYKIIDVFICKLRKKLALALDGEVPIDTIWGRGYMMRDNNMATADISDEEYAAPSYPEKIRAGISKSFETGIPQPHVISGIGQIKPTASLVQA